MEISEVRVRLVNGGAERLRAFCSVTFDGDFVIRDLKIIEGTNGYFVAMPSRKLAYRCGRCGFKNHLRARFCNECGSKLGEKRVPKDASGRSKLHVDVAHPINTACRERVQLAVIEAFEAELARAAEPGYKPATISDDDDEFEGSEYDDLVAELKQSSATRRGDRRGEEPAPRPAPASLEDDDDEPLKRPEADDDNNDFLSELPAKPAAVVERAPERRPPPPRPAAPPPPPRPAAPAPVPVPRPAAPPPRPAEPRPAPAPPVSDFGAGIL